MCKRQSQHSHNIAVTQLQDNHDTDARQWQICRWAGSKCFLIMSSGYLTDVLRLPHRLYPCNFLAKSNYPDQSISVDLNAWWSIHPFTAHEVCQTLCSCLPGICTPLGVALKYDVCRTPCSCLTGIWTPLEVAVSLNPYTMVSFVALQWQRFHQRSKMEVHKWQVICWYQIHMPTTAYDACQTQLIF